MAKSRLKLHECFLEIMGTNELPLEVDHRVYFTAPPTRMSYPCILYERTSPSVQHADNRTYRDTNAYIVTLMSLDPDDPIMDRLRELPMCSFDRQYIADDLIHTVYKIYF